MTSHLDSHKTTDIKPEMLSGVQTGNGSPHGKYNIRGIHHARTKRKDNIFMQRRLVQNFKYIMEWGQGTFTLTKRTRRWKYSALRHFFLLEHNKQTRVYRLVSGQSDVQLLFCDKSTLSRVKLISYFWSIFPFKHKI